ncbi:MAG: hypothetical protein ACYTAF_14550, partial [Planctomycetota bacterium]
LKEVTETEVAVEVKMKVGPKEQTQSQKDGIPVFIKEETVKVGETEHKCTVWKSSGTLDVSKTEALIWMDAQGRILKWICRTKGQFRSETTLVASRVDDEVKVPGGTFTCVKLEGIMKYPGFDLEMTLWYSGKVPGGDVKVLQKGEAQGKKITSTRELTAMEIKK